MAINKVILLGNVGKDPEVKKLDSGISVASFSLATSERGYTSSNGTQVPERTEWHNLVLWRGLADVAEKYIRKGDKLYVEGKIRTRSYDDNNGIKRYVTEIFVDNMEMLTPKSANEHKLNSAPASSGDDIYYSGGSSYSGSPKNDSSYTQNDLPF